LAPISINCIVETMIKKLKTKSIREYLYLTPVIVLLAGVYVYSTKTPATPELPSPPLKELAARHNIKVGNHAIRNYLDDKPYTDILKSEFDFVLADNTPNWYSTDGGLRPSAEEYNFKHMDEVMRFAKENNMPVEAHHYLWGEKKWLPDWLKKGNYTKEQTMNLMKDHIHTVGRRYSGDIAQWTVVNEPFTRSQHLYGLNDWWADHTGGGFDYIDQAFRWAREADPKSTLLINDFNNESINDISDLQYEYVKGALARGVPIDGIGMQMHIDGVHPPTKDEVVSNMKRFAELGLDIYVTEFDVNMNDVKADAKSKDEIQGNIYYEMMLACIESKVCKQFAYLGITDDETWYNHIGLKDPRPLMFDRDYQPKPAYYSTRAALEKRQ
jgi:endo-1,4-beta-xylanase